MTNSGRDYGSVVMFRKLLIRRVDLTLLSDSVAIDGGCGIVRDDHPRNTANVLQHVDVGLDPACLLHVREGFGIGVGAVTHGSNEHIHFGDLACITINDSGSITGPVDFDLLPGFPGNVHRSVAFLLILLDVKAEL